MKPLDAITDWEAEARTMLRAVNTAPHLFALDSVATVMAPKLAKLEEVSPKAARHIRDRIAERRHAMEVPA